MNWYDVEDVLYEGREEEIKKISCPDCKDLLCVKYDVEVRAMEIKCRGCGHIERSCGGNIPNFYKFFGEEKVLGV